MDIQYIWDTKENKFMSENTIKLNASTRRMKRAAKSWKMSTSSLVIEGKEEDFTNQDFKDIIFLLWVFHVYKQIFIFLATSNNNIQYQSDIGENAQYLIMLWEMYT